MRKDSTVVILSPGFPSSEADSTCLPMQQSFVQCCARLFPSINFVVMAFQYPYVSKTYHWHKITVHAFNGQNRGGIVKQAIRRRILSTLDNIHASGPITGILSFWSNECAYIGHVYSQRKGVTHLCWILGQDAGKSNRYPAKIPLAAGELVALSDFLRDEFHRSHGIMPAFVVPPGIDPAIYSETKSAAHIDL